VHGKETRVWDDQEYHGQSAVIHKRAQRAKDFANKKYRLNGRIDEVEKGKDRNKSRVRAKVGHAFGVITNIFGIRKVRYWGLAKNLHRLEVTAALTNLDMVRKQLFRT
jgi:transposase, IS5 family